ncbi:MAG: L,D-transpeptidase family protein [Alphaproteobacteria bacterium]
MIRRLILSFGIVLAAFLLAGPTDADNAPATAPAASQAETPSAATEQTEVPATNAVAPVAETAGTASAAMAGKPSTSAENQASAKAEAKPEPEAEVEAEAEAEAKTSAESEATAEAEQPATAEAEAPETPIQADQPTATAETSTEANEPAKTADTSEMPAKADQPAASAEASAPKPEPATPEAKALKQALAALPEPANDQERNEYEALWDFYEARGFVGVWVTPSGAFVPKTSALAAEIARADEWGLNPRDFPLPANLALPEATVSTGGATETTASTPPTPETIAADEIKVSLAVLKYGRYARGGRIVSAYKQITTHLDRRAQLLKPAVILEDMASAEKMDAFLRGLHPQHPQFQKLRQKYLALLKRGKSPKSRAVQRLLVNMEQWRWMRDDMGDLYVWNNIPEFMQRVVKDGKVIRKERIVAGEIGKQTSIFTRSLKKITFKPTWIVPDSIKAREIWPSLLRGGGLMRKWMLEMRTKEGKRVNWRKIDWEKTDILKYDIVQPNGPVSVMGKVKFTFPSQHTVFMHDTMKRDRYMFRRKRRTFSHGCMRIAKPIKLAEILLSEDKGWDAAHVRDMVRSGPSNNEIKIDRKIPIHTTYFTALVDEKGKLHTYPDVYGHERRIRLALAGKWDKIRKGRDHLTPVKVNFSKATKIRARKKKIRSQFQSQTSKDKFDNLFAWP